MDADIGEIPRRLFRQAKAIRCRKLAPIFGRHKQVQHIALPGRFADKMQMAVYEGIAVGNDGACHAASVCASVPVRAGNVQSRDELFHAAPDVFHERNAGRLHNRVKMQIGEHSPIARLGIEEKAAVLYQGFPDEFGHEGLGRPFPWRRGDTVMHFSTLPCLETVATLSSFSSRRTVNFTPSSYSSPDSARSFSVRFQPLVLRPRTRLKHFKI